MHSIEQQIYASLDLVGVRAGHHTHAASPGLSAQAIERHEEICNRWGSYEPGADFNRSLVQVPLWLDAAAPAEPSHFAVILITFQGRDAGGRPGAVLRHIVRVPRQLYEALDFNPFHLQRLSKLLESWTPETPLPVLEDLEDRTTEEDLQGIFPERYPLLRALLSHFLASQQLHLPTASDSPALEEILAQLLELTPIALRRRLSLATFAYRHASDYHLVGVRQEGASFRKSLEDLQESPPGELDAAVREYVDRLFAALEEQQWSRAVTLIQETPVPTTLETAAAPKEESDANGSALASPPGGRAARRPVSPPPPEMPYRRYSEQETRSFGLGRAAGIVAVVVLLVAGGYFLLRGRDGGRDPAATTAGEQLSRLRAGDLEVFVANHETLLEGMLAGGRRDFDVQEDLAAAVGSWSSRATEALEGESDVVDSALSRVVSGAAGMSAAEGALKAAAARAEQNARRGEALFRVMNASSLEALRQSYDEQSGQLVIAPTEQEIEEPAMTRALAWGGFLEQAAAALARWNEAAPARDASAWSGAARALEAALETLPAGMRPPGIVQAAGAVATSMAEVLTVEDPAALRIRAFTWPYRPEPLQDGELGEAAPRLRQAAGELRSRAHLELPPPVSAVDRFYGTLWDVVAPGLGGSAGIEPNDLLRAVASLCAGELCEVPHYAAHVARWKLEAWRRVGGPASAEGTALWTELGESALPQPGDEDLARVLGLLEAMEEAPVPAAPALVQDVSAVRSHLGGFYAELLDVWLKRQDRGTQARQAAFQQVYGRVRSALETLRAAPRGEIPAAYEALRQSMSGLERIDLVGAAAAGQSMQVEAVGSLAGALEAAGELTVERLEVKLLTDTDYTGERHPLARVTVAVARAGAPEKPLLAVPLPPMLSAPGVGFEKVSVEVAQPITVGSQERLLVTGRDEDGSLWFHYHVDPPAQGHVGTALATAREVRIPPQRAREIAASNGELPALGSDGDPVARVRIALADDWWDGIIAQLPELP